MVLPQLPLEPDSCSGKTGKETNSEVAAARPYVTKRVVTRLLKRLSKLWNAANALYLLATALHITLLFVWSSHLLFPIYTVSASKS